MTYIPQSFNFQTNSKGEKVYDDRILNIVQENLITISKFIDDFRDDARYSISVTQDNILCKTVKDPTTEIIGMFISKIIEGLGVIFTAGTPAAIITTIACKILSGIVSTMTKDKSNDSYNRILEAVNDLRNALEEVTYGIQLQIGKWIDDMEKNWLVEFQCDGAKYPEFKGKVKLADLSDTEEFFPKPASSDYIQMRHQMSLASKYEAASLLLPVRWKIRKHKGFPGDGISNFVKGWEVCFYKVRNRSTWDQWSSSPEFPNSIPKNLSGDIEGPYEYMEKGDYPNKQRIFGWFEECYDYPWSDGTDYETSKREWGGSRWMGISGKKPFQIKDNYNLESGTSFMDCVDDILSGYYSGWSQNTKNCLPKEPSYYMWYKTKRKNESVEIINDRRVWTLMGNDACIDWAYDSYDIFHWGRAYKGITFNHYTLVDENSNYAPDVLCKFLFKDNGHGKIVNPEAVAEIGDVYHNWGLKFE
jgi:hypothetical protein